MSLEFVDRDNDVIRRDAAPACEGGMTFDTDHFRALKHLHPVFDENVLESLQAKQRIDAIGAGVADAGGIALAPENALECVALVDRLVGKSDALPALPLGLDLLFSVLAEAEK